MHSSECWLAVHDNCTWPESCECLCHVTVDWDTVEFPTE